LSQARGLLAATSVDNRYALFGGYNESGPSKVVDIFDSLSGMWNTTTLSQARCFLVATSIGNLAFFGGGSLALRVFNTVDIFNSTSQTWNTATLSQVRTWFSSSSIGEIVAFGGGSPVGNTASSVVVDMLNVTSNTWFTVNLSQPRGGLASTSSTNKIFFGGGLSNTGLSNVVDIIEISTPISSQNDSSSAINLTTGLISLLFVDCVESLKIILFDLFCLYAWVFQFLIEFVYVDIL
jgi:hypothetical protein